MKANTLNEWTWAIALWCFRLFCLAWVAVVVLLGAKALAVFLER
jgi:hypothetical protein